VCGDGRDLAIDGVDGVEMYRCTPPYSLADAADADTIVVIGVSANREPPPEALDLLNEAHRRGTRIAAVGGDMCLHMIRQDFGSAVAADVARHLVVPPQRDGGQAPYIAHPDPGDDHGSLEPAMRWLRQRLADPVTLADIASYVGTSPRTVNRRFRDQAGTTPLQWLLRRRVHHAQELLETTDLSIEEISRHCGFGTSIAMRQHFAKHIKTSPTTYRRTFRTRTDV
jgi:transcriptional regulator GlxA family with amidase domain